jgi:hypothetical protein
VPCPGKAQALEGLGRKDAPQGTEAGWRAFAGANDRKPNPGCPTKGSIAGKASFKRDELLKNDVNETIKIINLVEADEYKGYTSTVVFTNTNYIQKKRKGAAAHSRTASPPWSRSRAAGPGITLPVFCHKGALNYKHCQYNGIIGFFFDSKPGRIPRPSGRGESYNGRSSQKNGRS